MMRPVVELSECVLCGVCCSVCPTVFILNDTGYIEVAELDGYPEDDVNEAIKNCPASCISRDKVS